MVRRMGDFKQLVVWQRARRLAVEAYTLTKGFPASELHGLAAQIQRSAIAVPACIAEGTGQLSDRDQARRYQVAVASSRELESHLLIASDLGFISASQFERVATLLESVQELLMEPVRSPRGVAHLPELRSTRSRSTTLDSRLP
jgi:four helix bundle protein